MPETARLHQWLTREIREGPSGPETTAFFDLDGTLIAGFSVSAFWRDRLMSGQIGVREVRDTLAAAGRFRRGRIGFSGLMTAMSSMLAGTPEAEFAETGERLFEEELAALIYPESRALVEAHRAQGHTLAIVSSATRYQIEPLARDLGIEHILCTRLEVVDGQFTGKVLKPTCFGVGKLDAARDFLTQTGGRLESSYFYTDSVDDLALLQEVGCPRPLNPDSRLQRIAERRVWPARHFESRGTTRFSDVARTAAATGAMLTSMLPAVVAAATMKDPREVVNTAMGIAADLGTGLAGVELRVRGEHHLWSHRPAVFLFNHQSALDGILVMKMIRRDVVAVAKRELRPPGFLGSLMEKTGTVFVNRAKRKEAIAALGPAVEALKSGMSLAIAPEGTRSPTPRLGPFKKGAFHMAMDASVPIVPIVFRNVLDAMPKHALVVRPAIVEALVLPPISTHDWKRDKLDAHIESVRNLYLEALASD